MRCYASIVASTLIKESVVGRAKEEMMRHQELQPMYDWIEDNYGIDLDAEGSDEWDAAVQAFDEYCERQQEEEDEWHRNDELEWYIYSQSQVGMFEIQMASISELLNVEVFNETQFSLLVMLHGHAVASVESYLASTFIHNVTNSETLIKRLVETDPTFSKMKFTLKDIYQKHQGLKITVATYLKDLIFHDLKKVKPMFKDVLDCDFGDISWLFTAVNIRHHCVHRAGLDKDGNRVNISHASIKELIDKSNLLVDLIEAEIEKIKDIDEIAF